MGHKKARYLRGLLYNCRSASEQQTIPRYTIAPNGLCAVVKLYVVFRGIVV